MDPKLERIRKLLAKAENPACPPTEAEALNEMAAKLMAKYGIEMAMLAAADPGLDIPGDRPLACHAPYAADKVYLLHRIATALRCRAILISEADPKRVHLFGHSSDLDRAELLFTSLLIQATNGMLSSDHEKPRHEDLKAWRRSWLLGFANEVGERLLAAERQAGLEHERETGTSTAVVVADRSALAQRAMDQAYPHSRKTRASRSGSGARSGQVAGSRADIGAERLAGSGQLAIGR